ncbi:radical SAM protein [Estrella lausannensis]|uniref:7-carboxy-7-deazaguanine synthase n=1 Tax=Estrella lausannensis TaxID=483423 RepID=A0A0H5DRK1_9BACT|nr:radical SAM protein [Estrella lausannensis]CRX38324.1 Putative radical activating enzyme [Estrella lausannensis]
MNDVLKQTIRLIEIFPSVQGETSFSGLTSTFIRLASCNLRCTWCDTTYSFGRGEPSTIENILATVDSLGLRWVCVTGGEPLLQKEAIPLMELLSQKGYVVSLETSGSLPIDAVPKSVKIILDIKCPGSGMESKNLYENLRILKEEDEVKFVIKDRADYDFACAISEKWGLFLRREPVLFSPVWGVLSPEELTWWMVKDKLKARLNLQMHKVIFGAERKGV